jgi:hypothetical protein
VCVCVFRVFRVCVWLEARAKCVRACAYVRGIHACVRFVCRTMCATSRAANEARARMARRRRHPKAGEKGRRHTQTSPMRSGMSTKVYSSMLVSS